MVWRGTTPIPTIYLLIDKNAGDSPTSSDFLANMKK